MFRIPMIPALLTGLLLTAPAVAQGPGGGPWGPPPRPPFAAGVVSSVNTTDNTLALTSRFGDSQTIHVASGAKIVTETTATVGDLKVGDQVQVRGIPTSLSAISVVDGQMPALFPAGGPGGPGMPPPGMGGPGGPGMGGPGMPPPPGRGGFGPGGPGGPFQPAMAMAHGKVTKLSPLTISVSNGVSVVLTLRAHANIALIKSLSLADIKPGDRIAASGQTGADGTLTADVVGVNLPRGGGFGGPSFGGPRFGQGGRRPRPQFAQTQP